MEKCAEILEKESDGYRDVAKRSFNADSDSIRGIASLGMQALVLKPQHFESHEGASRLSCKSASPTSAQAVTREGIPPAFIASGHTDSSELIQGIASKALFGARCYFCDSY